MSGSSDAQPQALGARVGHALWAWDLYVAAQPREAVYVAVPIARSDGQQTPHLIIIA